MADPKNLTKAHIRRKAREALKAQKIEAVLEAKYPKKEV